MSLSTGVLHIVSPPVVLRLSKQVLFFHISIWYLSNSHWQTDCSNSSSKRNISDFSLSNHSSTYSKTHKDTNEEDLMKKNSWSDSNSKVLRLSENLKQANVEVRTSGKVFADDRIVWWPGVFYRLNKWKGKKSKQATDVQALCDITLIFQINTEDAVCWQKPVFTFDIF